MLGVSATLLLTGLAAVWLLTRPTGACAAVYPMPLACRDDLYNASALMAAIGTVLLLLHGIIAAVIVRHRVPRLWITWSVVVLMGFSAGCGITFLLSLNR